ncbi:hypothetical protein [Fusibacter sp. 3D3]|uniref:hypothetical protein n=1 Tax=Fusibacter sp. 3D3 TaxID=1048380 RepID=UPI000852AF93|nr:hypothetical protein [Fusibacter sp. 3D3]GAU76496.1 hypothetical protein F3D3_1093 [Fusibacter sp. 3D3]
MINYIEEVEKKITLDEGIIAIEQFLINVYFESPISNKVLARQLCLPIPLIINYVITLSIMVDAFSGVCYI